MAQMTSATGSLPLRLSKGETLVIKDLAGSHTVTGSLAPREDASASVGAGFVVYGPQSSAVTVTISTTGAVDYQVVAGDVTPASPASGGGAVYYPVTDDAAGIALAAYQARIDGGGTVKLKPISYTIPAGVKFSCRGAVLYEGTAPRGEDGDDPVYVGGTRLVGPGSGICFGDNDEDRALDYPSGDAMFDNSVVGGGVTDMYIEGFDYGIKIGALREVGAGYMTFKNLHLRNNVQWGMWLENFSHIEVDTIVVYANGGGVMMTASVPTYNFGNSKVSSIIGGGNLDKGSGPGFWVKPRNGAQINAMQMYNIQVGGRAGVSSIQATTMSNGSQDIGVPDLSKFAVDMAVRFSSSNNGLTSPRTYFVTEMSGDTGAGTIKVATLMGGASITMTGSSANTIETRGWSPVVIGGRVGTYITWSSLTGASDIEQGGVARVVMQGIRAGMFEFGIIGVSSGYPGLCLRDFDMFAQARVHSAIDVDADNPYNHQGALCGWLWALPSAGLVPILGNHGALYLNGREAIASKGNAFSRLRIDKWFTTHGQITNGATLSGQNENHLTYVTDTPGGAFTLQSSTTDNMLGFEFSIFNATANTVTMNYNATSGAQIAGKGLAPANSFSIAAWTDIQIRLVKKGSTFYWAVL